MNILEIEFYMGNGGASRFIVDLCNVISRTDNVTVLTVNDDSNPSMRFNKQFLSNRVKYVNLGCKSGYSFDAFIKVYSYIKRTRPDVVHVHTGELLTILPALRLKGIRFISTLHNMPSTLVKGKVDKRILEYLYKTKRLLPVTISEECEAEFEKMYKGQKAEVIINGRSTPQKTDKYSEVKAEIESYKRHSDDLVFLNVARLDPAKNHEMLVEAFNSLKDEHVILLVIGEHFQKGEAGYPIVEKAGPNIKFLGVKTNVADYLYNSDFFTLSSKWEGLPISLLEALACGTIPVCTPAGGIPTVIRNGENGFLAKGFDMESYVATIKYAIAHRKDISREVLFEEFRQKYSMEECAAKYLRLYRE